MPSAIAKCAATLAGFLMQGCDKELYKSPHAEPVNLIEPDHEQQTVPFSTSAHSDSASNPKTKCSILSTEDVENIYDIIRCHTRIGYYNTMVLRVKHGW